MPSSIGGFPIRVHPGDFPFWVDTNFNAWEPETLIAMRRIVRPGALFCDIGAWVGPTSIYAAKLGARVTCFEPDPVAYERLLFNLRLNVAGLVTPFNLALGGTSGVRRLAPLAAGLGESGSSLYATVRADAASAEVLTLSWKDACVLLDLPRFDAVKIDIEGAEAELLPEMISWLRECRPGLLLAVHWRFVPADQKPALREALEEIASLYPSANSLDWPGIERGFPSLVFSS